MIYRPPVLPWTLHFIARLIYFYGSDTNVRSSTKYHPIILSILWAVVHVLLFRHYGVRNLIDSKHYLEIADHFLTYGKLEYTEHFFYVIPISLMAFFRWVFPDQIMQFLIFQSFLSGIAMIALYKASSKTFDNPMAGFFSCIIFLFWWDYIHWNTAVMTESLACSFTLFVIYKLTEYKNSRTDNVWIIFLLIIAVGIRPTGVITIVGILSFLVSYHWDTLSAKPRWKFFLTGGFIFLLYFSAYAMAQLWDFTEQFAKGNIITYADSAEGTPFFQKNLRINNDNLVFPDPGESELNRLILFAVYNPVYFLNLAVWKVWYLLSGMRPYYSLLHNACTLIWTGCIYALCFIGWKRTSYNPVKYFALAVVVANCALIAISSADWDNRFYIPMEPGLVLLAGGGAAVIWQSLKIKLQNA
jgi:hypothetical protein